MSRRKETVFTPDLPVLQELTKTTEFTIHEKLLRLGSFLGFPREACL